MDRIDNYKIIEKIGEGGMGEVYKGIDTMLEREVAIKMLRADLSRREDIVERFRTEAIALGRLNHTHIATVYNFGRYADQYYMAMEFVPGETLERHINRRRVIPWREAVDYAIQVLQGLAQAHQAGVIHRDIKPGNIIVTPDKQLKLLDFGIARILQTARLTKTRHTIGTPEYMSPEQHLGKDVDARSDIYAVGMLLYEMLLGALPFKSDTEYVLVKTIIEKKPASLRATNKSIPPELDNYVLKALEKQPGERFASAQAFINALSLCLKVAAAEARVTRLAKDTKSGTAISHRPPAGFVLGFFLVASASYGIWWTQTQPNPSPTESAIGDGTLSQTASISPVLVPATPSTQEDYLTRLQQAAAAGEVSSQLKLADMYSLGKGVAKDDRQAFDWYRKAADAQDAEGQFHAGTMFIEGRGTAKDVEKGVELLTLAARQKQAAAPVSLGRLYLRGYIVPANIGEARPWLEAAARQDGAENQYKLGHLFLKGTIVPQDLIRARYWFEQAAGEGLAKAQYNVGWMMQEGLGGEKRPDQALEWYKKAAKQGYDKAQYSLATMLYHPKASSKTNSEALAWLRKSADQDFPLALRWLAEIYRVGIPGIVARDVQKAEAILLKVQTLEGKMTKSP